MTKKKSKKPEDEQFELKKSKSTHQTVPLPKNRAPTRIEKDKKQPPSLPVYNKMIIEDRKAYEQKYRQNLVSKRIEEEKRGFRSMKYDLDADSQMGDIDEDSVSRRNDDETIKKIKEMLEEEEMIVNKERCTIKARNQLAKVEKLSEIIYERKEQYREIIEKIRPGEEGVHELWEKDQEAQKEGEMPEAVPKSILQRIGQLEGIYY